MGAVTAILGAANVGMGAYQSYADAQNRKLEADLAADSLETRAARKDLEADEALSIGEMQAQDHAVKSRAEMASQRVGYAASGVKLDAGSTAAVAADTAAWNEYDRQKIAYEANLQSWGLAYDAAMLRKEAANTRAAGQVSGGASGLLASSLNGVNQLLGKL